MKNYVYMSGVVISVALIIYILVSKRVPSKTKGRLRIYIVYFYSRI